MEEKCKRIRLTTTMRNLWEEISENSFKGNITKTVWKIFGNADLGWLRLFDPGSPRKRDIYWFWRGMDILYSTSNSNQWSSQNTEHWKWVRCKFAKKQEIIFFESFAHKNSKLIEKIDIYDLYPPLPFTQYSMMTLSRNICIRCSKMKWIYLFSC